MRKALHFATMALAVATSGYAVPIVSLHTSNVGISNLDFEVVGTTISISETWSSNGPGAVQISGLDLDVSYTVIKTITNNTGTSWTRLASELLDPTGNANDGGDILPYPAFVPAGFSTSNNSDGLSFDQGGSIPRISSAFGEVLVDELTDVRDFVDFFDGTVADGGAFTIQYGLLDQTATSVNQPFLLVQRPNADSRTPDVPEPGSMALLGSGLAIGAICLRRAQR
jgi:hypothetical protein